MSMGKPVFAQIMEDLPLEHFQPPADARHLYEQRLDVLAKALVVGAPRVVVGAHIGGDIIKDKGLLRS